MSPNISAPNISARVDKLFESGQIDHAIALDVLSKLQDNQSHVAHTIARYFVLFLTFWAIFTAVGSGFVKEGSFSVIKVSDPRVTLIVAPVLIGGMFYLMSAAIWSNLRLLVAIWRFYKHLAPTFYELHLEKLLAAPTLFNTESAFGYEFMSSRLSLYNSIWLDTLAWSLVAGTFLSLVHVSFMLDRSEIFTTASVVVSILAGAILWCRGAIVWIGFSETSR